MFHAKDKITKGDCECCERTDVVLTLRHGNMLMCPVCLADDIALAERSIKVVEDSRKVDATIELKQDLFNAGTIAFTTLQAAIEANPEIPADKKNYSLMEEVAKRIDTLTAAIFSDEAALLAKKNERHALLVNAQNVAARLHEVERAKFKQYDVNYKPVTPKSVKPKAVKAPSKKFNKTEVFAAAKKYNVPAASVQSIIVSRNMSAEDAAKHLAGLMGLI